MGLDFSLKSFLNSYTSFQTSIALRCVLPVEGWGETPVDVLRSEARVELDALPSLKTESLNCWLSDGGSVGGLSVFQVVVRGLFSL